ncbi:MAG: PQQ-dependent sugar dehydrogenase [Leptolyngbyaceae cyanobacterium SL_7_1]|nr:PQQ-dependent sugar dehydrogenase [Leptolyngbyaceae cyanobacterium SL_7_1]
MVAIAGCTVEQPPVDSSVDSASPAPTSPAAIAAPNAAETPSEVAAAPITNVRTTAVLEGLEHPWGMAWLPDGSMLITERPGRLRIVRDGVLDPTPIAGVPDVLVVSQAGLLDISLHPRFAENRLLYLTYSHGTPDANRTRVARAVFDGQALSDLQVIFEVERDKSQGQHFGSRITWLPDETMLVSIGDGGNPPIQLDGALIRQQAQNLKTRLGKIVRLNDDGSIPADNPFVNADAEPAIWSYGHRNIQGLTIDPATNRVWATEHGSRGGDEANLIEVGQNYGWPLVTHSREYSGGVISNEQSRPGLIDPKQVWTPAIAPSGLALYRGDRLGAWDGDLFVGGLVSQTVHRLDLDESGNVIDQQPISIGQRVRDVRQGPDGLLYVLTDEPNGRLIRLEPEF